MNFSDWDQTYHRLIRKNIAKHFFSYVDVSFEREERVRFEVFRTRQPMRCFLLHKCVKCAQEVKLSIHRKWKRSRVCPVMERFIENKNILKERYTHGNKLIYLFQVSAAIRINAICKVLLLLEKSYKVHVNNTAASRVQGASNLSNLRIFETIMTNSSKTIWRKTAARYQQAGKKVKSTKNDRACSLAGNRIPVSRVHYRGLPTIRT